VCVCVRVAAHQERAGGAHRGAGHGGRELARPEAHEEAPDQGADQGEQHDGRHIGDLSSLRHSVTQLLGHSLLFVV
jgi:hypothetical protein